MSQLKKTMVFPPVFGDGNVNGCNIGPLNAPGDVGPSVGVICPRADGYDVIPCCGMKSALVENTIFRNT
jgi:hypothetical protein